MMEGGTRGSLPCGRAQPPHRARHSPTTPTTHSREPPCQSQHLAERLHRSGVACRPHGRKRITATGTTPRAARFKCGLWKLRDGWWRRGGGVRPLLAPPPPPQPPAPPFPAAAGTRDAAAPSPVNATTVSPCRRHRQYRRCAILGHLVRGAVGGNGGHCSHHAAGGGVSHPSAQRHHFGAAGTSAAAPRRAPSRRCGRSRRYRPAANRRHPVRRHGSLVPAALRQRGRLGQPSEGRPGRRAITTAVPSNGGRRARRGRVGQGLLDDGGGGWGGQQTTATPAPPARPRPARLQFPTALPWQRTRAMGLPQRPPAPPSGTALVPPPPAPPPPPERAAAALA